MSEIILCIVYGLFAIGTAIGSHNPDNSLRFREVIACVVIGIFWPVIIGAWFGKDFK